MLERLTWGSGQIACPGLTPGRIVIRPDVPYVGLASGSRRWARKAGVAVVGFSVLAAGLALIVLPGPAIVVIPLGLAILAKEFSWASRLLDRLKNVARRLLAGAREIFDKLTTTTRPGEQS